MNVSSQAVPPSYPCEWRDIGVATPRGNADLSSVKKQKRSQEDEEEGGREGGRTSADSKKTLSMEAIM